MSLAPRDAPRCDMAWNDVACCAESHALNIVAIFCPFSRFCEISISLLSLQKQPNTAPNLFQRGVEYGKYAEGAWPRRRASTPWRRCALSGPAGLGYQTWGDRDWEAACRESDSEQRAACDIISYYIMLYCYIMLYYSIFCYIMLYYLILLYHSMLYHTTLPGRELRAPILRQPPERRGPSPAVPSERYIHHLYLSLYIHIYIYIYTYVYVCIYMYLEAAPAKRVPRLTGT